MPIFLFAADAGNKNADAGKLVSAAGNIAADAGKRIRKEKR